jgi:hypothetical protein
MEMGISLDYSKRSALMKIDHLIRNSLLFLEEKYGFQYKYINNRGNYYIYENKHGVFQYYEWAQFGENEFTVRTDQEIKTIDMLNESPKLMGHFVNENRGFKRLFSKTDEKYWDIIHQIVENEINKSGTLFGIRL